jgi:hypothetical protein
MDSGDASGIVSMTTYRSFIGLFAAAMLSAAAVAACSGQSSSIAPSNQAHGNPINSGIDAMAQPDASPTGSPTPKPSPPTIWTGPGHIYGTPDMFTPPLGNTNQYMGQPIDGVPCAPTMSNNYHVHVYIGLYVNGVPYSLAPTVGMYKPQPHPQNNFWVYANCYYDVHTHDQSGYVHIESPDPTGAPITSSIFTTQQLFDEWGITVNSMQFGQFSGPVQVFTNGQSYHGGPHTSTQYRSSFTQYFGDPSAIPLYSHEVIFYEVGPTYPTILPNIVFYSEW